VPIELVTGPANAGKAQIVLDAVRARAARGERPLLVVPTESDEVRYRRELAEGGLVLGARVERFEGLLSEIVRRAALGEAALGALARERVLELAAHALAGPAGRGPRSAGAGLARELGRLIAELRMRRLTPRRLRGALKRSEGEHPQLERLCAAYEAYEQALNRLKRADREQRVCRALDALRRRPSLWGGTPVMLYGFDSFTELQLDAIETLGVVVDAQVIVSLAYEPGRVAFADRAGTFERLRPQAASHTALPPRAEYYEQDSRDALHHLERSLFGDESRQLAAGGALRLLEGGSPRAELELVAGEVRALLDEGVAAQEIAIVHRSPESVEGPLCEVLEDFEIPHALRGHERFADTALGRGLIGLLRCAAGDAGPSSASPTVSDLLAWMRTPGVIEHAGLVDRLEASARRRGAVSAQSARALWEAEHWPLDRIARVSEAAERGPRALIDAVASELERLFCAPRRRGAVVLARDELAEARALAAGRRALEELRELARAGGELAPDVRDLTEALEGLQLPSGERPRAGVVTVVDPLSLRARRVRMLFLCGMREGVFPKPPRPQPLVEERERRELALASGLVLPAEQDALAAERYLLYAIVSRPRERLTLSWHAADDDGMPLARSLFVDDVCELFEESLHERTRRRPAGAAGWPGPLEPAGSMAMRLAPSAFSTAVHGSVGQSIGPPPIGPPSAGPSTIGPPPIGPLTEERVLGELRARVLWSASSIEAWAGCPVKWFVERWLRPNEIEPRPEPIAKGGLAHAALRDTLERLRERTGSARLSPANVDLAKRILREALAEGEERYPLSVAPERVPGARRRLEADLERYLEHASLSQSPLEPEHLELEFGFDESGLPPLELGEGVMLRGRIDRVDVGKGGDAVVYDYKASAAPASARWQRDGAVQVALYMSAVDQLLGKRVVGGFYQPLSGKDLKARGVLDADSGIELDCVKTDRLDRDAMDELLAQCRRAALDAVAQAREGELEPRPDTCAYGGGCSYPTLCRCGYDVR
jgi:ATP-dependent helicase/DNAse subunit B